MKCAIDTCNKESELKTHRGLCNTHRIKRNTMRPIIRKTFSIPYVTKMVKETFELYKDDKIRMETLINIFTE